jgi:hypothetical protein
MDQQLLTLEQRIKEELKDLGVFTTAINPEKGEVYVDFDLANTDFWVVLTKRGVKKLYRIIVSVDESKKAASVQSEMHELEWSAGVPKLGASYAKSFQKGTQYQYSAAKEWKFTGNGLEEAYSYSVNTTPILARVKKAVKDSGYKVSMDAVSKGAVIFAGVVLVLLVLGGLFVLVDKLLLN